MKTLCEQLENIGCNDIEEKIALFEGYRKAILEANKSINLTRITDPEEFEKRHFAESLIPCSDLVFQGAERIIDVGSGAGFPGVPIAIVFPDKEVVLLDSLAKRMDLVRGICDDLGIDNVTCVHARAEEAARDEEFRESFDICISRAVAELNVLSEYCLPFVREGGCFIAVKGKGFAEELEKAEKAIEVLGGETDHLVYENGAAADPDSGGPMQGGDGGASIYIMKKKATPDKYPRPAGKPSKKPIR